MTDSDDKIKVEASGAGLKAIVTGLSGKHLLLFLIFVMLGGILMLMVRNETIRDNNFSAIMTQLNASMIRDTGAKEDRVVMMKAVEVIAEEQRATTYVLTLDQKQRDNLRLQMPKSLRDRAR